MKGKSDQGGCAATHAAMVRRSAARIASSASTTNAMSSASADCNADTLAHANAVIPASVSSATAIAASRPLGARTRMARRAALNGHLPYRRWPPARSYSASERLAVHHGTGVSRDPTQSPLAYKKLADAGLMIAGSLFDDRDGAPHFPTALTYRSKINWGKLRRWFGCNWSSIGGRTRD